MFAAIIYDPEERKKFRSGIYIVEGKPVFVLNTNTTVSDDGRLKKCIVTKSGLETITIRRKTIVTSRTGWLPTNKYPKEWDRYNAVWGIDTGWIIKTKFSLAEKAIVIDNLSNTEVFVLGQKMMNELGEVWDVVPSSTPLNVIKGYGIKGILVGLRVTKKIYEKKYEERVKI